MKRCSNCGIITRDDSLPTCQNCGHSFPAPEYQAQPEPNTYQQQFSQPDYQQQPVQNPYQQQFEQPNSYQQQPVQNPYQQQPVQNPYQQQPVQNSYQQVNQNPTYPVHGTQPDYSYSVQPEPPMKWYKWIIYGMLFLSMALSIAFSYQYFTGKIYVTQTMAATGETISSTEESSFIDGVYELNDGLQTKDMICGVILIISAAFALYVRQLLAKRKTNAPNMLLVFYLVDAAINITIYFLHSANIAIPAITSGAFVYTHLKVSASTISTSLIAAAVGVSVNKKYFDKRKHLFCN